MGLVAGGVAVASHVARLRRHSDLGELSPDLVTYLRDHLSGSDVVFRAVRQLRAADAARHDEPWLGRLVRELAEERSVIRRLVRDLGSTPTSFKRAAAATTGHLLRPLVPRRHDGLARLRTLEGLAVGLQGKRCLWRALQNVPGLPASRGPSFAQLEDQAIRQWQDVEARRLDLAAALFSQRNPGARP